MLNTSHKTTKKRIAFVGGPDIGLRMYLIKKLAQNGFDMAAIGSEISEKELFEKEGIPFHHYKMERNLSPLNQISGLISLYRIFKRERFDIVHAFDTIPTIIARIAARLAGVSIVVGTIPGLGALFSEENISSRILRRVYGWGQKCASAMSVMTIFQNDDDREYFLKNRMVSPEATMIIRGSGVDTKKFSVESVDKIAAEQIRDELGLRGKITVCMITRLVRQKGIKEYLEAAEALKKKSPDIAFLLVGPEEDTISPFPVAELKEYSDTVTYTGPRRDIPELLFVTDIAALPSYYREGIPRALLEAASMGKPIVTTDLPGCRETVEEGKNGFFVPPCDSNALADAIWKLVADPLKRQSMGEYSRRKAVAEFDSSIVFEKHAALYKKLL